MAERVYLTGAHVFDGSGSKPLAHTAVVAEENRIADVLDESSLPSESSALRIEGSRIIISLTWPLRTRTGIGMLSTDTPSFSASDHDTP